MPISAAQFNKQERTEFLTPVSPEANPYQKMEEVQKVADAYWPEQPAQTQQLTARPPIPAELQEQANQIIDQIGEHYGHKSLSQRLLALNERVALATEGFVTRKKNKEHDKKDKIESKNIPDHTSWKNWQATWSGTAAFGGGFLEILGAALKDHPVGKVLSAMSGIASPAANLANTYIDGKSIPIEYERSYFMQTTAGEKQAVEGLKNLPKEIQQLIQKLADIEAQAWRSIGQRG